MNLVTSRRGRRLLFAALYFVEGAPVGFLWWALPSLLRARGVEPDRIGALLGALVLPWALKWLWSPCIDRFQGPRWSLRSWIVAAQLGMAAALVPLLWIDPVERFELLVAALGAHALCASTQDAAIDALMIRVTPPGERGQLVGWMQAGMLAGRSMLGGGALLLHGRLGEGGAVVALLAVLGLGFALAPLYAPPSPRTGPVDPVDPARANAPGGTVRLAALLVDVLRRRSTGVGLAFAATAGAGFEALGGFAGPLLTDAAGGQTGSAGRFFLVHAALAMAAGGLVGGRMCDRLGARRASALTMAGLGAAILVVASRADAGPSAGELSVLLAAVYVGIGGFTAASYALFMELTEPRLAATQFSAYMGATNLCESWAVAAAGRMIGSRGYGPSIALLQLASFAALGLLPLARMGRRDHSQR